MINNMELIKQTLNKLYNYIYDNVSIEMKDKIPKYHESQDIIIFYLMNLIDVNTLDSQIQKFCIEFKLNGEHKNKIRNYFEYLLEIKQSIN